MASEIAMAIAHEHVTPYVDEYANIEQARAICEREYAACAADIDAAIRDAVKAEREACESIVLRRRNLALPESTRWTALDYVAGQIRARNPQQETHDE